MARTHSLTLTQLLKTALRARSAARDRARGSHIRFVTQVVCLDCEAKRITIPAGVWRVKFSGPLVGVYVDKALFKLMRITLDQLKVEGKVTAA